MTVDTEMLRRLADGFGHTDWSPFLYEAADEIDRLRAERALLRVLLAEARKKLWVRLKVYESVGAVAVDSDRLIARIDAALDGGEEA